MKLKTKFTLTVCVFGLILAAVSVSAVVTGIRARAILTQEIVAGRMVQLSGELSYLTHDYFVYRESRQLAAWRVRFDALSSALATLHPSSSEERELVRNLEVSKKRLKEVFDGIVAGRHFSPEKRSGSIDLEMLEVAWSRMAMQTHTLIADATRLAELLQLKGDRAKRINALIVVATVAIFGAYFLVNTSLLQRRILRGMSTLNAATAAVRAGRFDYVIAERRRDEIDDALHAFNQMTKTLRETTVSRDALMREVEQRKTAEEALQKSNDRLRTVLENSRDVIYRFNVQSGRFDYISPAARDVIGFSSEELMLLGSRESIAMIHPEDQVAFKNAIARLEKEGAAEAEYRQRTKTGGYRWVSNRMAFSRDEDGQPLYRDGAIRDITHRIEIEHSLRELNSTLEQRVEERNAEVTVLANQLRQLASELTLAEQRERQRIARVLHDHIQQMLVAAKLQTSVLAQRVQNEQLKGGAELVSSLIDQTISASRDLTSELSPPVLYDAGLGPALQWLARSFLEKHGLSVEVQFDPLGEPEDDDVRTFLFDAVREMLFNVTKHSGVSNARIQGFRGDDDRAHIVVSDEGKGFDPTPLQTGGKPHGFGLFSIQQRLKHMGGRVGIESTPGKGTRVKLVGPPASLVRRQSPGTASQNRSAAQVEEIAPHPDKIRVVLADDHHIIRQGIASLLRMAPDLEVVGEASNGEQAVALTRSLRPDVVIMDISMPVMNGIDATRAIKGQSPEVHVVGLSMHTEGEMSSAILAAGAAAYVMKGGPPEALINAIRIARRRPSPSGA